MHSPPRPPSCAISSNKRKKNRNNAPFLYVTKTLRLSWCDINAPVQNFCSVKCATPPPHENLMRPPHSWNANVSKGRGRETKSHDWWFIQYSPILQIIRKISLTYWSSPTTIRNDLHLSFSVGIPWYELQHKETFLTFKLGDIFRARCISGLILSQTWIFCCESMWWTRILDSGRRAGSWSPHGSLAPKHAYMTWLRCLGTQYCRCKKNPSFDANSCGINWCATFCGIN